MNEGSIEGAVDKLTEGGGIVTPVDDVVKSESKRVKRDVEDMEDVEDVEDVEDLKDVEGVDEMADILASYGTSPHPTPTIGFLFCASRLHRRPRLCAGACAMAWGVSRAPLPGEWLLLVSVKRASSCESDPARTPLC